MDICINGINNPLWKETLAMEALVAPVHAKGSSNNWKKGVLSVATILLLLAMCGVPISTLVVLADNGAVPLNLFKAEMSTSTQPLNGGVSGDFIYYALTHWGGKPTLSDLYEWIIEFLIDSGFEYLLLGVGVMAGIEQAAGAILALGVLTQTTILEVFGFLAGPVGWTILAFLASYLIAK